MKTAVCYFTGTGNSLFVAERLKEMLPEAELFPIAELCRDSSALNDYDVIGIVFPVYFYGLPNIIKRFVSSFSFEGFKYLFAVATYGAMVGNALSSLKDEFSKKGLNLSYSSKVLMPDNYTVLFPLPNQKLIELRNASARQKCEKIANDIKSFKIKNPGILTLSIAKRLSGTDGERDRKFIMTAACDGCGKCVNICPVGNISMKNGKPQFHHDCEFCLACFHRCPQKAINYGAKTIRKGRYINPEANPDNREKA
ncbi:MAG: EFR1 family ferrodoxin [Bacillota bacterium]|nr:EFR1 family ferrodoxin [Bacillota bacterium]